MTGTLEAVQIWWASQGVLTAQFSTGNLWLDNAPIGTALPYAAVLMVAEPVVAYTTGYQLVDATIQINCMAATASQALSLCRSARTAYNKANLPPQDDRALHCLGGTIRITKGVGLGLNGGDCWVAYAELDVLAERDW